MLPRIASELRLAKADNLDSANTVLRRFIADYNRRFARQQVRGNFFGVKKIERTNENGNKTAVYAVRFSGCPPRDDRSALWRPRS